MARAISQPKGFEPSRQVCAGSPTPRHALLASWQNVHFYIKYCPWGWQGGLAGVIAVNPGKPESYPQKLYSKRKDLILAHCPLTSTHMVREFQGACKLKCIHTHTHTQN